MTLRIKQTVLSLLLAVAMLLPAVAAYAKTVNTTLNYTVAVTGPNRDFFNAQDMTVKGTYRESENTFVNTHRVELWRNRFGPDDFIGSKNVTRSGFASAKWSNVGGGTYRTRYVKANDGVRITSNNLQITDQ